GPHLLSVVQTLHTPVQALTVQFRLTGTTLWINGPAIANPAATLDVPWNNGILAGGKTYDVKLVATDLDGRAIDSNVVTIHSDLFTMTSLNNLRSEER